MLSIFFHSLFCFTGLFPFGSLSFSTVNVVWALFFLWTISGGFDMALTYSFFLYIFLSFKVHKFQFDKLVSWIFARNCKIPFNRLEFYEPFAILSRKIKRNWEKKNNSMFNSMKIFITSFHGIIGKYWISICVGAFFRFCIFHYDLKSNKFLIWITEQFIGKKINRFWNHENAYFIEGTWIISIPTLTNCHESGELAFLFLFVIWK